MPRNTNRSPKPARRPSRKPDQLKAIATLAVHVKHYLGASVVLLALALAYFLVQAHHIRGSVEVTRNE
jgi:hypothetical protein